MDFVTLFTSLSYYIFETILFFIFVAMLNVWRLYDKLRWTFRNTVWFKPSKKVLTDLVVEVWEISITDSVYGGVRGEFTSIKEYHFPELKYSYNTYQGRINHILFDTPKRYNYKLNTFSKESQPKLLKIKLLKGNDAFLIRNIAAEYRHLENSNEKLKNISKELAE